METKKQRRKREKAERFLKTLLERAAASGKKKP